MEIDRMTRRMTAAAPFTPATRAAWLVLCFIVAAPVARAAGAGAPGANDQLAAQTLAIFGEKCFSCHTTQSKPKPKKFNYVDDLAKLAANPKFIVPGDPDKSVLYKQIVEDEMPPEDSDVQPLTPAQRMVVRAWIAAGAPAGRTLPPMLSVTQLPSATQDPGPSMRSDSPSGSATTRRASRPFFSRLVTWLGKFHPLAAHTPIAVLMAAAIAEMLFLKYRSPALTGAARFCTVLGALGAIATAALGWAMAANHSSSELLENHRWTGTAAAILAIPIALLGEWGARRAHREGREWHGPSRWLFRLSVFFIAGFVGFAAHIGGLIHWGEDFFQFPK
jgi:uncharacterized membrane protein/mono/diheme cytochrome c family protein